MDKTQKRKKWMAAGLILLALLLVAGGVFFGMFLSGRNAAASSASSSQNGAVDQNAQEWQGKKEPKPQAEANPGIAIPGFKSMTLKAGEKTQAVNLYNPEVNDCYFVMTLMLPDGTHLWKSGMVEPGKGFYEITLNQVLKAGTYPDSTLKYECFAQDEAQTPLNGSEVKFELIVE